MNSDFNKIISFVLGLIVVVVFFAILSGKLNLKNKLPFMAQKVTPTVTPTPTVANKKVTITYPEKNTTNRYTTSNKTGTTAGTVTTIPSTGAPVLLFPLAFTSFAGGLFLRKKRS